MVKVAISDADPTAFLNGITLDYKASINRLEKSMCLIARPGISGPTAHLRGGGAGCLCVAGEQFGVRGPSKLGGAHHKGFNGGRDRPHPETSHHFCAGRPAP